VRPRAAHFPRAARRPGPRRPHERRGGRVAAPAGWPVTPVAWSASASCSIRSRRPRAGCPLCG